MSSSYRFSIINFDISEDMTIAFSKNIDYLRLEEFNKQYLSTYTILMMRVSNNYDVIKLVENITLFVNSIEK